MEWIDNIILGLSDLYGTNNPYELCEALGIEIVKTDSNLLSGNNSLYIRDFCDKEVIFIRDDLNKHHEEFYIRHELGHALLHVKIFNTGLCYLGKLERQANYFALKLSGIIFDEIELNQMSIEQIASCLELPYEPLKQMITY